MSIGTRLTLLGCVTVAAALLAFTALSAQRTREVLQHRSEQEVTALANGLLGPARTQVDRHDDGRKPLRYQRLAAAQIGGSYVGRGVLVLRDGTELPLPELASAPSDGPAIPADLFSRAGEGPFRLEAPDGTPFVALVAAVPDRDAVVFAALSDAHTATTIAELRRVHEIIGVALLVAFGLVMVIMVRIGLRPLRSLTRSAARLADGSSTDRLAPGPAGTEIGQLATALNRLLDTVSRTAAERERTLERTQRFASDAAHELRTPVTAIIGYAELYQRGALADPDRLDEVFGRIHHESSRIAGLVEGLLTLDRIDARTDGSSRRSDATRFDVTDVCAACAADSMAIGPQVVTVETDGPIAVTLPRDDVTRIVSNLLANVRSHTPPGTTAAITVTRSPDAEAVRIVVADDGPGIPEGDRAHVFERFYRAGAGRARGVDGSGSGLGLAIVSALVADLGGSVRLVDASRGTAVEVSLPTVSRRAGSAGRLDASPAGRPSD